MSTMPSDTTNTPDMPLTNPGGPGRVVPREREAGPKRSIILWVVFLLVLALASAAAWRFQDRWLSQAKQLIAKSPPPAAPPPRVVPVVAAPAVKRDLKLFLNGLGTVTPLMTVTIRARVDGELEKIAFTEGQLVREGQLLAEIDPRPYETQRDQAAGQLARDEATLKTAKITLERLRSLAASDAVAAQDVDNQIAIVQQTEGMLKTDRAMVANAELQLSYCKIVSPINGVIGLRLMDVGNIVRANDANGIAVINQVQPIALVFTISQDEIPRVQKRMRESGELIVEAYDRAFTTKLASGTLLATDNQVDATTGTLRLKAIFPQQDEATLFPNQFVNTRLLVEVKENAIVIPSVAIQRGPNSTFVYVVKADETVELRKVQIGPTEGTETSIESGLREGEQVVTDGLDKLQPNTKVSLRATSAR